MLSTILLCKNLLVLIISILCIINLTRLYIFDGADSRTPYVVSSFLQYLVFCIFFSLYLIKGFTDNITAFYIVFIYIFYLLASIRSSLLNSKHINGVLRNILYIYYNIFGVAILLWCCLQSQFVLFQSPDISINCLIDLFSLTIKYYSFNTFMLLFVFIALSCALRFFISYKNKSIKICDFLNFYSLFALIYVRYIENYEYPFLSFIVGFVYIIIPFFITVKEYFNIVRKSKGINERIIFLRKQINDIIKARIITNKIKFQIKHIVSLFEYDAETKNLSLMFFSQKKILKFEEIIKQLNDSAVEENGN